MLPQLWFRNTWSWGRSQERPRIALLGAGLVKAEHPRLGVLYLQWEGAPEVLVCDNDTNFARLYGQPPSGAVKDAFHDAVVLAGATGCAVMARGRSSRSGTP